MKTFSRVIVSVTFLLLGLFTVLPFAFSMDDPGFSIGRMVVCKSVVDREPVGAADTFSAATDRVYCFLEAKDIAQDTEVVFVWYYKETEMAKVKLPLRKGERWRTKSSKKLAGLKGSWKIELQNNSGIVINTVSFTVQ